MSYQPVLSDVGAVAVRRQAEVDECTRSGARLQGDVGHATHRTDGGAAARAACLLVGRLREDTTEAAARERPGHLSQVVVGLNVSLPHLPPTPATKYGVRGSLVWRADWCTGRCRPRPSRAGQRPATQRSGTGSALPPLATGCFVPFAVPLSPDEPNTVTPLAAAALKASRRFSNDCGAAERVLRGGEALRDHLRHVVVDDVLLGLHHVREALHAERLGARHGDEQDVRSWRDGVGRLDVQRDLKRPQRLVVQASGLCPASSWSPEIHSDARP